ncbi:hypothetical protein, partial [Actinomadura miaoliensis]
MTNTHSPSLRRRVAGWSLLSLTVLSALPLAAAAFLLAAAARAGLVPSAVLALACTVLACGAAAGLGARLALRRRR